MRRPIVGSELWNTIYKVKCPRSSMKKRIKIKRRKKKGSTHSAGLTPRRPMLDPRPVHVRFMVVKSVTGTGFSSPVSIITPAFHTHSFMHHGRYIITAIESVFEHPLPSSLLVGVAYENRRPLGFSICLQGDISRLGVFLMHTV
jgi:hypothetical protein